jgi:hypothetical protein
MEKELRIWSCLVIASAIEAGRHLAASINTARINRPGVSDQARAIEEVLAHIQACAL